MGILIRDGRVKRRYCATAAPISVSHVDRYLRRNVISKNLGRVKIVERPTRRWRELMNLMSRAVRHSLASALVASKRAIRVVTPSQPWIEFRK